MPQIPSFWVWWGEPAKEFEFELALTIISMLESSPKQYANQILNKVRELSKLVHDLKEEDKAFIDTLDVDAQLIMKGKRIASLEALRNKIGWQDDDIVDQVFRGVNILDYKHRFRTLIKN